ncbi:hypothetical protein [Streptomyces sp. NBC_01260]|uniref:hypothetical protein n=1 Tax=Streptomyces sp. NBC_01260 TaxID=2903801 RepID=UPI003FCE4E2D
MTGWVLTASVVGADAGYGVRTPFRHGLEERGCRTRRRASGRQPPSLARGILHVRPA